MMDKEGTMNVTITTESDYNKTKKFRPDSYVTDKSGYNPGSVVNET